MFKTADLVKLYIFMYGSNLSVSIKKRLLFYQRKPFSDNFPKADFSHDQHYDNSAQNFHNAGHAGNRTVTKENYNVLYLLFTFE
jgi:hypothetical protein